MWKLVPRVKRNPDTGEDEEATPAFLGYSFQVSLQSPWVHQRTSNTSAGRIGDAAHSPQVWSNSFSYIKALGHVAFHCWGSLDEPNKYNFINIICDEICSFGKIEWDWGDGACSRVKAQLGDACVKFLRDHFPHVLEEKYRNAD